MEILVWVFEGVPTILHVIRTQFHNTPVSSKFCSSVHHQLLLLLLGNCLASVDGIIADMVVGDAGVTGVEHAAPFDYVEAAARFEEKGEENQDWEKHWEASQILLSCSNVHQPTVN